MFSLKPPKFLECISSRLTCSGLPYIYTVQASAVHSIQNTMDKDRYVLILLLYCLMHDDELVYGIDSMQYVCL